MKIRLKFSVPSKTIPVRELRTSLDDALSQGAADGAAKLARPMKAPMRTEVKATSATAGTDDRIYGFVNDGTRPHIIVAKNAGGLAFGPSAPKTTPGSLSPTGAGGGGGVTTIRKRVMHPGTKPRRFDKAAAAELEREWPDTVQRKLGEAADL